MQKIINNKIVNEILRFFSNAKKDSFLCVKDM